MRVLTYNIHHGAGVDGRVDIRRIADVINEASVDVAFLQEVDRGIARSGYRDIATELAEFTGMGVVFGKSLDVGDGEYGTAILCRHPVHAERNVHYMMSFGGEQRGLLSVETTIGGQPILLMDTHIDNADTDAQRLQNAGEAIELAAAFKRGPIILAGDFNDTPGSRTCQLLSEVFDDVWAAVGDGNGYTLSSRNPRKRIDFIWVRGADLIPHKVWVPYSCASDHLPVVAEFTLRAP